MTAEQLTGITAPPKAERRYYRPELDALRFVAFALVFGYHLSYFREQRGWLYASVVATGSYGMSLFFVLSSYLITTLLMKERAKTGTVAVGKFYARRVLRIWPLYIVFLIGMYFVGRLYSPWFMHLGNLAAFFLLAGNWYLLYAAVPGPVMPLWSISLEEQFYLVWPTLFKSLSLRRFAQASVAVILVSWVSILTLNWMAVPVWRIWWNTLPQLQFFGLGALLAVFDEHVFLAATAAVRVVSSALAVVCFLAAGFVSDAAMHGYPYGLILSYIMAGIGCVLVFQAFREAQPPAWWLYLGRISYGLYVFHQLSLDLADIWLRGLRVEHSLLVLGLCGFALTVAIASVSFPLIEKPFLRWKKRFEIVRSR